MSQKTTITQEEFEMFCAHNMNMTLEEFRATYALVIVPCDCDYDGCQGWRVVAMNVIGMTEGGD